jgi:hypothetical protein
MGQAELYAWFKKMYDKDPSLYFTVKNIQEALKNGDLDGTSLKTLSTVLRKLYLWGYLEIKTLWLRPFRYRLKASVRDQEKIISPLDKDITVKELRKLR